MDTSKGCPFCCLQFLRETFEISLDQHCSGALFASLLTVALVSVTASHHAASDVIFWGQHNL